MGIYNAKNVLQGNLEKGSYTVESTKPVSVDKILLPTIDVINAFKENDFYVGFAITLSAPLPSKDYRIKIEASGERLNEDLSYYADRDFKNGTNYYMMSDGKDFYQRAYSGKGINSSSSGIYSVGIYDAKGNLVSNKRSGNFNATPPKDNQAPTLEVFLPNNIILGKSLTGKLVSTDPNGDLVSVGVSLDGEFPRNITTNNGELDLNYTASGDIGFGFSKEVLVTAYDTFNNKSEYSTRIFFRSDLPKPINESNKSYTKIANDGSELSDMAQLGNKPRDWACTRDNSTGLIWEIKTDDMGLRNRYDKLK